MAVIVAPAGVSRGAGPTPGGLTSGVSKVKAPAAVKAAPTSVAGFQSFLNQQGYLVPVDGINGPLTAAAAADFRGSRNPQAFNVGHGLVSGDTAAAAPSRSLQVSAPKVPKVATGAPKPTVGPSDASLSTSAVKVPKLAVPKVGKPSKPTAAGGPTGSDVATAKAAISAIIAPLIQQIRDAEQAQSNAGQQAISGYTTNAENQLKGIDFAAPYQGAAAQQNAVNAALLASLQGQGSGLEQDLGAKLADAGAASPLQAALTGGVGTATKGAANAQLAQGDATLSQLLQSGAAEGAYGAKLPAVTALAGAQDTGKLQGQIASDLRTQLGSVEGQVPNLIQSELTNLANARNTAAKNAAAEAIAAGYLPGGKTLTPKARASLAAATGYDPVTGQPTARTVIQGENARTSATRAQTAARPKASSSVSKELGYLADSQGNPILRNGQRVPVSGSGKALTPGEAATIQAKAQKDAEDLYHGVTKTSSSGVTTVVSYSVPYEQAISTLINRYPSLGMKGVLKLVNSQYPAGGTFPDGTPNGRPVPPETAAQKKAVTVGTKFLPSPFQQALKGGK